jgi:hypothetical protein
MFLSKLLYQQCVAGGKFNLDRLLQHPPAVKQMLELSSDDARWKRAMKTIRPFIAEAKGGEPSVKVLPIHCVNRCASGQLLFRLGLKRNPFVLLGFADGTYLLGDLSQSLCYKDKTFKPLIYGFDGMLIWDLFHVEDASSWALIYRNKSVLTGGGGELST